MNTTKSFRGLIASGDQVTLSLQTIRGEQGYKINKFQIFPADPGTQHYEHTVKLYKILQTTVDNDVDFSDPTLLGAAYYQDDNAKHYPGSGQIVFDNEIFNQNVFITSIGVDGATVDMNYYLELEIINLTADEATVATLKDIRNND